VVCEWVPAAYLDTDGDGCISAEELRHGLMECGIDVRLATLRRLMAEEITGSTDERDGVLPQITIDSQAFAVGAALHSFVSGIRERSREGW
jgi:hypothetical protein